VKPTEYAAWVTREMFTIDNNKLQKTVLAKDSFYNIVRAAFEAGQREPKDSIRYEGVRGLPDEDPVPEQHVRRPILWR
jgi:hypothetical protein